MNNINEYDKLKIFLPKEQVKTANDINQIYFLGGSFKQANNNFIIEVSGKLFSSPEDLGSITAKNIYDIPEKIYNNTGAKINEDYFFNNAYVGIVHVKNDIPVENHPSNYLSELREKFKCNTDVYDVYRYGKLKYTDGLCLIPKSKARKVRFLAYNKYAEISKNKSNDFGYFNGFDYEYLEKLKNIIRFEFQFSSFDAIREAFDLDAYDDTTISNIMTCETDVVVVKFTKLLDR